MNNYTIIHIHTMLSQATTVMDSVTSYEQYVDRAVECNMNAIAFTEHGNVLGHIKKKKYCNKSGIKYIHGVESYLFFENDYKRDYHILLLAKNYDGVLEINRLHNHMNAYKRGNGNNFYRRPRISFEQLKNTSENIIITTACLGGVLYPFENQGDLLLRNQNIFLDFLKSNKDRVFLEVQHHNIKEQIEYNKYLSRLSKETGIRLVAGTDTHSLNKEHEDGRRILQKSKGIHFDNEDGWDLTFKTYDELVYAYEQQNALDKTDIIKSIENTNVINNMIQDWDFDRSKKYPKLYDDSMGVLKKRIREGLEYRGHELNRDRKERIRLEVSGFKKQKSIDFLLLEDWIKQQARDNNIHYGVGRGSIGGSYLAYLLQIHDIDTLKYELIFERFMNPERQSEPDIDTDYYKDDIPKLKDILFSNDKFNCAEIITYNTIQTKGAIRDVGRAMEMDLGEVDYISKNIDEKESEFRNKYPELFKYVDLLSGTIVSIGSHPAAVVVTDREIYEELGTLTTSTSDYPIVQLDMKEVEYLKYIKLDLLKLNNIGVINKTYELIGKPRAKAEDLNLNDDNVFDDMIENGTTGVFQLESPMAYKYTKELIKKDFLKKLQEYTGDDSINRFDMSVVASSLIRPVADGYRDKFIKGEFADYGNKDLNNLLKESGGYLLWQEQIIFWLNKFCDYSLADADLIRRGFAKKTGTEQFIPDIKNGFINHMTREYGYSKDKVESLAEEFITSIINASEYLFNKSHNYEYGLISYHTAYLRYYYPLEFLTASLRVYRDNEEKVGKYISYAKSRGISIREIKFGKSKGEYFMDSSDNCIYQGIGSIKYLNSQVGDELYELSQNNTYNSFIELLYDLNNTSIQSNQIEILIRLEYFNQFGNDKKLLTVYKLFDTFNSRKQLNKETNRDLISILNKLGVSDDYIKAHSDETDKLYKNINFKEILLKVESKIPNSDFNVKEKIQAQLDYLTYINKRYDVDVNIWVVTEISSYKNPYMKVHNIRTGDNKLLKLFKYDINKNSARPKEGDFIKIDKTVWQRKNVKVGDKWVKSDQKQLVLKKYMVL